MKLKKIFIIFCCFFLVIASIFAVVPSFKVNADTTITDLTDTTWIFNQSISFSSSYDSSEVLAITFSCNSINYDWLTYGQDDEHNTYIEFLRITSGTNVSGTIVWENGSWVNDSYRTINITGSSTRGPYTATSSYAINWISSRATYFVPYSTYTLTTQWEDDFLLNPGTPPTSIRSDETIVMTFMPYNVTTTGYEVPEFLVTGCSYTWNRQTSQLTLYNATGNVTVVQQTFLLHTHEQYLTYGQQRYTFGYNTGHTSGYAEGYEDGEDYMQEHITGTEYIGTIANGVGNILGLKVFGQISIGVLLFIPLLLGVIKLIYRFGGKD